MHEFEEQYFNVVRNQASITLKITKCTTIGPPRIGKTCLKNLLIGLQWDVEAGTASTDVMEAPEWVECYSLEEGGAEKQWKLLSAEQQQGQLIRAVYSLTIINTQRATPPSDVQLSNPLPITTPRDDPPTTTPSDTPPTTTASDAPPTTTPSGAPITTTPTDASSSTTSKNAPATTRLIDAPPTTTPSDVPLTTMPSNAPPTATPRDVQCPTRPTSIPPQFTKPAQKPATVLHSLEALAGACSREALQDFLKDKQGKVLGETRLVHFIDTGGQAIYHDVHPVLITSPSVYLVVFNLEELYETSLEGRLAYFRSDLIQRPLRSIYTFGTKAPRKEDYVVLRSEVPKILVVGTHLDQVPLEDSGMEHFLDDISRMIEKEIGNKPYRQFVQYDTKGRSFWAVDNTLAGKEQREDVKKYNADLRKMVQEGSTEMSVKVPLPWMLLKLVMDSKRVRYCKYSQLLEEACSRGYVREDSSEADLDTMLWLFHILGLIYYKVPSGYKKGDSLVFIDPDCLYSATSDFLVAAKEEIEDSSEAQHQTQAASRKETEGSQGGSEEGQHQTQAVFRKTTEDGLRGNEEGLNQTQAASTEESEGSQEGSENCQHQTQVVFREETKGSQGGSEEHQHQTEAAFREGTESGLEGSEEGQHQTQAVSREETEGVQRGGEEDRHQTEAVTREEIEDGQGGIEEHQHQTQADFREEINCSQGGSEKRQHQSQAVSRKITEDSQEGSEEGQHQTQAASTKETEGNQESSEECQHQIQAASIKETEERRGGSEEGQHLTQAVSKEEFLCDEEKTGERGKQIKQEPKRTVQKERVIKRIQCTSVSIKRAVEEELWAVEQAMKQKATEDVLTLLHDQLKIIDCRYKLPAGESRDDVGSVKVKKQLYIHRLVKSLASSVKAVLGDAGEKGDVHRVRREVGKAVESIREHYQSRSIDSQDMDQVLSILSDLRLVAKLNDSDRYVVPAALPQVSHSLNIFGHADPILVTVVSQTIKQVCFLPSGLFCCLISELVTKLGWTVEPLGRTHVAFTHKLLTGVVHIVEHESYIEIKLESQASLEELSATCQKIRDEIHRSIVSVYKTLYSDPTSESGFEESLVWGFQCEEHPGDNTHIAAFRKIADDEYWTECLLEPLNVLDVEPEQLVWFIS